MSGLATRRARTPLVAVFAAVCAGAAMDYAWGPAPWLAIAAAALACYWALTRFAIAESALASALLVAAGALGGAAHHAHWRLFAPDDIGQFAAEEPQPVALRAIVSGAPRELPEPEADPFRVIPAEQTTRIPLRVVALRDGAEWKPAGGRTFAMVPGAAPPLAAGDRVLVYGRLARLQAAENPGEYDARRHARRDRILAYVRCNVAESVTKTAAGSPLRPQRMLDELHGFFRERLFARLPERQHALAAAMLLGDRYLLHIDRRDELAETGLANLIAVSGLHVGLAALFAGAIARVVSGSRRASMWTTLVAAAVYAVVAGAQPPALRATVVIAVAIAGELLGRRGVSWNSLAAAGLVVFVFQPSAPLIVGPQLSFLAVAILIALQSCLASSDEEPTPLERLIARTRPWHVKATRRFGRAAVFATVSTAAIWAAAAPLVAASFQLVAPAGLVLGPLVVPPLLAAMYGGFAVLILPDPFAALAGRVCSLGLAGLSGLVDLAPAVGLGPWRTAGPSAWALVISSVLLVGVLALADRRRCWPAAGLLAASAVVGLVPFGGRPVGELRVTFASVGHGLAVVIAAPEGQTLLYDAGAIAEPRFTASKIAACLHDAAATRIDAAVVSHADADHYNALPRLLEWFPCRQAYLGSGFDDSEGAPAALVELLAGRGVPTAAAVAGDVLLDSGGCVVRVLHPPPHTSGGWESDNAGSVVLLIEYAGRRILLAGDLEGDGLARLLASRPIDCDVALAPHHGSPASAPPEFFTWCAPETLIVSGGRDRADPAALEAFRAQAPQVFHTAVDGAVSVVVGGEGNLTTTAFAD